MMRAFSLLLALCLSAGAHAAFNESTQCPGKASPRADIIQCNSFDTLGQCTTGYEAGCASDNAVGQITFSSQIYVAQDTPAQGGGYLAQRFVNRGFTGTFGDMPIPSGLTTEFGIRYYMRFGPGATDYAGGGTDHTMVVHTVGEGGCWTAGQAAALIIDMAPWRAAYYAPSAPHCLGAQLNFWPNGTLLAGAWHLIEFYGKMETACTDITRIDGCNGKLKVFVDGAPVPSFNEPPPIGHAASDGFNWCGKATGSINCTFSGFLFPQTYYNSGMPPWGYEKDIDGVVITNTYAGSTSDPGYIGASAIQNSLGSTANTGYPYITSGNAAFIKVPDKSKLNSTTCSSSFGYCSRHAGGDCAVTGIGGGSGFGGGYATFGNPAPFYSLFSIDTAQNDGAYPWMAAAGAGTNCDPVNRTITSVDAGTDIITVSAVVSGQTAQVNGAGVIVRGTMPGGLTTETLYYVRRAPDATHYTLHLTSAAATANTGIVNITNTTVDSTSIMAAQADGALRIEYTSAGTTDREQYIQFNYWTGSNQAATAQPSPGYTSGYNLYSGGAIKIDSTTQWVAASNTDNHPILVGFKSAGFSCASTFCEYIGVTVDQGRWALRRFYFGTATTAYPRMNDVVTASCPTTNCSMFAWRGPKVTTNTWHKIEVGMLTTNKVQVWIDGRLYGPFDPPWTASGHNIGGNSIAAIAGNDKNTDAGVPTLMWIDDLYAGTVSRVSCSYPGWGADCASLTTLGGTLPIPGQLTPAAPVITGSP